MAKWCFGIDLGGTTVKCALFQTDGTVEEKWEIVTRTENNGESPFSSAVKLTASARSFPLSGSHRQVS